MDKNVTSKELNAVLRGEQMAVEAYERFIKNMEDPYIKKEFEQIQQDHKMHADILSRKIQSLGATPESSTGFSGLMANTMIALQTKISRNNTEKILKRAYDGEDKGIGMVEEIIKGDLDADSRSLMSQILSTDHHHLKTMADLISKYEQ